MQKASTPRKSGMDLPILLRMPESLAESSSIPVICGRMTVNPEATELSSTVTGKEYAVVH
jgi:hypothetical protein